MSDISKSSNRLSEFRFGAVFFDDPENPEEAWATIHGNEPERVGGTGDLPSDVIWVSNVDWNSAMQSGLISHPNIKISTFFRSDIKTLSREFGFNEDKNVEASQHFAEIFDRVVRLLIKHYNVTKLESTLKDSMRPTLLSPDRSKGKKNLDYAIESAMQTFQRCEGRTPKGSKMLSFRFPRVEYARKLLEFPVPLGNWKQVRGQVITADDVSKKFAEKPVLCKISIRDIDPTVANLVSFSNGSKEPRFWATSQEIYYLSKVSDIEIQSTYVCEGYESPSAKRDVINEGKAGELSVSCGLIAENHWVSMASPYKGQFSKINIYSDRATWMRAWDRMLCFVSAKRFADAGFHISSYGTGSILVAIPPSMLDYALEIAGELRMIPPVHAINELLEEFADGLD